MLGAPGLDFETWETTISRYKIMRSETWSLCQNWCRPPEIVFTTTSPGSLRPAAGDTDLPQPEFSVPIAAVRDQVIGLPIDIAWHAGLVRSFAGFSPGYRHHEDVVLKLIFHPDERDLLTVRRKPGRCIPPGCPCRDRSGERLAPAKPLCQTEKATGTRCGTSREKKFRSNSNGSHKCIIYNKMKAIGACSSTVRAGDS